MVFLLKINIILRNTCKHLAIRHATYTIRLSTLCLFKTYQHIYGMSNLESKWYADFFFHSKYRNISGYYLQCSVYSTWYCMIWALISSKQMQFIHMPIKLRMLCISQDWFNYLWNYWSGSSKIFILIGYSVCCALHRVRIIFYSHSNSFIFAIKKDLLACYYHVTWFMYTEWCYSKYLQPLAFNHVVTNVRWWKFIADMSNYSLNSS